MNPSAPTIDWQPPSSHPPLAENEIHVWATTLSVAPAILEKFASTLSADERERVNRFKFEKHRNRYLAGRGALRAMLAPYFGTHAAGLRFEYLENGKPALTGEFANAGIHFNLAHTGDLALAAITRVGMIGVDVESVRPIKNVDELVARFFSPRESKLFQKLSEDQKPAAFFNLWTRKEAMLKATGEGITRSLNLVEVSFLPGDMARVVAISGDAKAGERWCLRELWPAKGFTGAVAVEWETLNIEHRTPNVEGETSNIQHRTSNIQGMPQIDIKCWKWNCES
ncbi:MAG TPA: 4'-phosphopantetheinyl transferase superfamily protein [Verrucomicrobiae bacterium]|nr:4'-phosphopantetheinyl transferase superfamily protein [Verrucomicrobiae bacterium]